MQSEVKKIITKRVNCKKNQHVLNFLKYVNTENAQIEIYNKQNINYINASIYTIVFKITDEWLKSNLNKKIHYIIVHNSMYINVKAILHIYRIYSNENLNKFTEFTYNITNLYFKLSNNMLELSLQSQLTTSNVELDNLSNILEQKNIQINELLELNSSMQNEITTLDEENVELTNENTKLIDDNKELNNSLEIIKDLANKLAKYVRVKSKKIPDEVFSDIIDTNDSILEDTENLEQDAYNAKNKLKFINKSSKSINKPSNLNKYVSKTLNIKNTSNVDKTLKEYYLLRSPNYVFDIHYKWVLTDIKPDKDNFSKSEEFLIGDISHYPYENIVYRTLQLSKEHIRCINLFLEVTNGIVDENSMDKLIS